MKAASFADFEVRKKYEVSSWHVCRGLEENEIKTFRKIESVFAVIVTHNRTRSEYAVFSKDSYSKENEYVPSLLEFLHQDR